MDLHARTHPLKDLRPDMLKPEKQAARQLETHQADRELFAQGPGPILRDLLALFPLLLALSFDSHVDGNRVAWEEFYSKEYKSVRSPLPMRAGS